jgi:hypothetical protein
VSKRHYPAQPPRHAGALIALLAAASLLIGVQALAPPSALALNDEGDVCPLIQDDWERLQCEQEQSGTGVGTGSSTDGSGGATTPEAQPTETPYSPTPTYEIPGIFNHTFDRDTVLLEDRDLSVLHHSYKECNRIWNKARRATRRARHRLRSWVRGDSNDEWIQDDLHERWMNNDCGDVFDLVGRP